MRSADPMRRPRLRAVAAAVAAGVVLLPGAAPWTARDPEALARALDRALARGGFSGTLLVARGDRVILERGYGLADRETGEPNRPETVFKIASLTKPMTAVAALRLAERGRIDLDAPVSRYLPRFPGGDRIAVHHLLTHSSGLPQDLAPLIDVSPTASNREAVGALRSAPLAFEPGRGRLYSNAGYSVLAAIVEQVTGRPFAEHLRDEVLAPAGMTGASVLPEGQPMPLRAGYATGYALAGGRLVPIRDASNVWWGGGGAGGVLASAGDLHRFQRALSSGRLLGRDWIERMRATKGGDGYGWSVSADAGLLWAVGDLPEVGFHAWYAYDRDRDLLVAALTNTPSWNDRGDYLLDLHADSRSRGVVAVSWLVAVASALIAGATMWRTTGAFARLHRGETRLRRPPWPRLGVHAAGLVASLGVLAVAFEPWRRGGGLAWRVSASWARAAPAGFVLVFAAVAGVLTACRAGAESSGKRSGGAPPR